MPGSAAFITLCHPGAVHSFLPEMKDYPVTRQTTRIAASVLAAGLSVGALGAPQADAQDLGQMARDGAVNIRMIAEHKTAQIQRDIDNAVRSTAREIAKHPAGKQAVETFAPQLLDAPVATVHRQVAPSAPAPAATPAPASVGNQRVVDAARTKLGSPYVYGANGPSSFDCSGLVQWAYAQTGKSIPRTSGAQIAGGTPVPLNALQPGDIVGFYSGISHVGIYIGNGQVIHAPTSGDVVKIAPMSYMPAVAAARY